MPFVLDASIAAAWHFNDAGAAAADALLDALSEDTAIAPSVWWFEIRNIIVMGERRGRTSQRESEAFLQLLSRLPLTLATLPNDKSVIALARQHRLTVYDACYLELALREHLALATLDAHLADAARAEGVAVIPA